MVEVVLREDADLRAQFLRRDGRWKQPRELRRVRHRRVRKIRVDGDRCTPGADDVARLTEPPQRGLGSVERMIEHGVHGRFDVWIFGLVDNRVSSRKFASRGGDGSSPQNAVLLTKLGDEAVPAPFLNSPWVDKWIIHSSSN